MRSKAKGKGDNDRKHQGTGDADDGRIDVNCDHREGALSKGNDTNDDGGLSHGLHFYFESEFHPQLTRSGKKNCQGLKEECCLSACARRKNPGTVSTAEATATAPPWFLVRAKNQVVRK
jgi:hypothetical protein